MQRLVLSALLLSSLAVSFPDPDPGQEPFTPAAPIRGVVVDEAGRPLGGVRYWISGYEERQGTSWVLTHFTGGTRIHFTEPDGSFEVPGRAELRYDLDFDSEGHTPAFVLRAEAGSEQRVVMRRGRDLAGRVVQVDDEGERPIHHARVSVRKPNPRGLWFERETTTGADGAFEFPGFLPSGEAGQDIPGGDAGWGVVCAGAHLPLRQAPGEDVDDVRIEIRMARARR